MLVDPHLDNDDESQFVMILPIPQEDRTHELACELLASLDQTLHFEDGSFVHITTLRGR